MKKLISILLLCGVVLCACKEKGEHFEINGYITSASDQMLYFEAITLNGVEVTDSVKLNDKGDFDFEGPRPYNPEFYRLRIGRQLINLAVDSTETLKITADLPTMSTRYTIEGSPHNLVIKELSNKQIELQEKVDRIAQDKQLTLGEQERLINQAVEQYKADIKKNYILKEPSSSYAYFALFQVLGNKLIFNPVSDPEDVKYISAVATAWDQHYAGTTRAENLHNIAIQGIKNTKRPVSTPLDIDPEKITAAGIIDIELPDIYGKNHKLSDISNKVVLLDFTAYSLPSSQERIMQMRELYHKYSSQGFEIYQVSIDPDEHYWKTACEHLPWICVYENQGEASGYLVFTLYAGFPPIF